MRHDDALRLLNEVLLETGYSVWVVLLTGSTRRSKDFPQPRFRRYARSFARTSISWSSTGSS